MKFQPTIPPFLDGSITATVSSAGLPPTQIFGVMVPFDVTVNISLTGSLKLLLAGSRLHVRARVEPIGPDPAWVSADHTVTVSGSATVGPVTITNPGLPEGAYIVVAVFTATNSFGAPIPVAGFSDEMMIQTAPGA